MQRAEVGGAYLGREPLIFSALSRLGALRLLGALRSQRQRAEVQLVR